MYVYVYLSVYMYMYVYVYVYVCVCVCVCVCEYVYVYVYVCICVRTWARPKMDGPPWCARRIWVCAGICAGYRYAIKLLISYYLLIGCPSVCLSVYLSVRPFVCRYWVN